MVEQFGVDSMEGVDVGNPFKKCADEVRWGKTGHSLQGRSKEGGRGESDEEMQQGDGIWGAWEPCEQTYETPPQHQPGPQVNGNIGIVGKEHLGNF